MKLEEQIKEFEHLYNPLVFYCRLVELNVHKDTAMAITKRYQRVIYEPTKMHVKYVNKNA